jgi:hypothetical protein
MWVLGLVFCQKCSNTDKSIDGVEWKEQLLYIGNRLVILKLALCERIYFDWHTTIWAILGLKNHMHLLEICTTDQTCVETSERHTYLPV